MTVHDEDGQEGPPLIDLATSALFLDIDGTLLDIAPTPTAVFVPPGLRDLLHRICLLCDGALALVTGRPIGDADRLFSPFQFDIAGGHGSEWRLAGHETRIDADGAALDRAIEQVSAEIAPVMGLLLERKRHSLAIHYRLAPDARPIAWAAASRARPLLGPGARLMAGKSVVELLPESVGKGRAIARFLMETPYAGRTAVFLGDDVSDEEGFETVNQSGGLTVRIGEAGRSSARFRLGSTASVRSWLNAAAEAAESADDGQ